MDYGKALMFEPSSRDMKLDYPELADIEEFENLSARELKFVWYVGNRTSPLAGMKAKQRVKAAAATAWGDYHANRESVKELSEGKLPDKIKKAIDKMSSFSPSVRLKAKFMQEYIFDKMQNIIIISPEDMDDMDADERKKYTDLALKVSSELPNLVSRLESGNSVKVKEQKTDGKAEVKRTVSDIISKIN